MRPVVFVQLGGLSPSGNDSRSMLFTVRGPSLSPRVLDPRSSRCEGPSMATGAPDHAPRGTEVYPQPRRVATGAPCSTSHYRSNLSSIRLTLSMQLSYLSPKSLLDQDSSALDWGRNTSPTTLLPRLPSLAVGAIIGMFISQSTFLRCSANQSYLDACVFLSMSLLHLDFFGLLP